MVGCVIVQMGLGQDGYTLSAETERESEEEKECIGKFGSSVIILVLKRSLVSFFLNISFSEVFRTFVQPE